MSEQLTIRDHFAMNINVSDKLTLDFLQTFMGDIPHIDSTHEILDKLNWLATAEARYRYLYADAMLKVREENGEWK